MTCSRYANPWLYAITVRSLPEIAVTLQESVKVDPLIRRRTLSYVKSKYSTGMYIGRSASSPIFDTSAERPCCIFIRAALYIRNLQRKNPVRRRAPHRVSSQSCCYATTVIAAIAVAVWSNAVPWLVTKPLMSPSMTSIAASAVCTLSAEVSARVASALLRVILAAS